MTTPMKAHVMHDIEQIEEEHRLAQTLEQQLLGTTYHTLFETTKGGAGVVTPLTSTKYEIDSDEERGGRR